VFFLNGVPDEDLLAVLAAVLALGLTLTMADAEATKRLGAGSSSGMQREVSAPTKAPATTTAALPTQPKRSWMGPLAGLAAGLGLAALASHLGVDEELASMMMIGLLVMVVMVAVGLLMRRRAATQQSASRIMAMVAGCLRVFSRCHEALPHGRPRPGNGKGCRLSVFRA
jgi:hypothetical protein